MPSKSNTTSPSKSQDFAKQVLDGTLSFSNLEGCDAELSANQNPLIIKYNQLFLLRKDRSLKSPYLSYWPFFDFSAVNGKKRKAMAMATNILASIPVRKDIDNDRLPDPNKKNRTLEKKNVLIQQNIIGSAQTLSANQIHTEYKKYIAQRVESDARPIHRLYSQALEISPRDFTNVSKLAQAIADDLLDPFYSSNPAKYRYATFGLYEQEWKHVGYSRGDLIKSLSLCPGETVTLEYHYWDKTTIKSEQELSSELELKSSSTLTQRDSKELLDELTKNNQFKLDANAKISIPIPPVDVSGGDEAGISSQIQPHVSNAVKSSVENVVSVSNDFKQTRKVRIEETRETGREEKQTRVIANTNRCHTLEFRYFEVLSNYVVTSSCVGFEACLLLPFIVACEGKTFSYNTLDAKFILCNEHVLKSVLIDPKFAAGFDAAKKLESFDKLKELFAANVASAGASTDAGSNSTSPLTGSEQAIENEYRGFRTSIVNAYATLNRAADDVAAAFANLNVSDLLGLGNMLSAISTAIRRLIALTALDLDSDTHNAIKALSASTNRPARQAMRDFFAKVSENDFQFLNPVTGDVADALEQLGVPFSDQIAGAIFDLGIIGLAGNTIKDDAGLHDAVQAAESFFDSTDRTATGRVTTPPAGTTGATPTTGSPPPTIADFVSINDVADASVELERLICHIKCNFDYYKQALWLSKGPDYRAEFLAKARVSQFVSNEVVGFFENFVAFPIIDPSFLRKALNVQALLKSLSANKPKDTSALISIPTPSTTMSGQLGECDLCETYIGQSRDADVRQQNAKAALDEAEAAYKNAKTSVTAQEALRIAARLASRPPDLTDPIEHSNAKLDIAVTTQDTNP
jgi:hypothetical protein